MRMPSLSFVLVMGLVALSAEAGSERAPQRRRPLTVQRFRQLDKNGDGRLTPEEWKRPILFARFDRNRDGVVTLDEVRRLAGRRQRRRAPQPLARLDETWGIHIAHGKSYDNQPAVVETDDGIAWVAYVRYHAGKGDEVVVVPAHWQEHGPLQVLTAEKGQYLRPALAAHGQDVWCVWTASEAEHVSSVWVARRSGGRWTAARRLVPDETRAHQNPEIAAASDGRVAVAYQVHDGRSYDLALTVFDGKRWQEPHTIGEAGSDDWDPAVAFDTGGKLHVVWCGFRDGDYDVYWSKDGAAPRRISARGEYDLHPWVSPAPDGTVWVSWDVVRIPGHASSGPTTITGANRQHAVETGGRRGARASVQVKVLDGDRVRLPGEPRRRIVAPPGYALAHVGFAKVAHGRGGEPWVFYRVLRRAGRVWLPRGGIGYYWDLLGRPFRDGRWQAPIRFARGDGYLEEAGLCTSGRGIRVAFGGERRAAASPDARRAPPPPKDPANHHHDYDGRAGCNGEIYLGLAGDPEAPGPATAALRAAPAPADEPVPDRGRVQPYAVDAGGKTYHLLWGDTHRHSNLSRCSQGAEPTPDDLYRYGTDICRYDFFALSDHAEHHKLSQDDAGPYYWWLQRKLADLYHVPGAMTVLYDFEWTMTFPHGHHNTIFPSRPTVRLARNLAWTDTLAKGWKVLSDAGVRAITIPHTGADPRMGTDWSIQDDRYQRLCEIFQSCRGSYEHAGCPREFDRTGNKKGFYWNALAKGYHVGVIASSDHGYGVAYACVYAAENTREAVWQAMWDRRTYGATTYGLVLDVRSGTHWMGEAWTAREGPRLDVYVRGTADIRSVEVLGRSRVLDARGSAEAPLDTPELRFTWTDRDWAKQTAEQWYYVRVIQTDDEMAWSSPVWVKPSHAAK